MPDNDISVRCDAAITGIAQGDKESLAELYRIMGRMVYSVAYSVTGNVHDSEDVLQDTLCEVLRCAKRYRKGSNAKAWVLKIARNTAIDCVRRGSGRGVELTEVSAVTDSTPAALGRMMLEEALSKLKDDERQIVCFKHELGLTHAEIAKLMSISLANAEKKYQRAVAKLRVYFKDSEE